MIPLCFHCVEDDAEPGIGGRREEKINKYIVLGRHCNKEAVNVVDGSTKMKDSKVLIKSNNFSINGIYNTASELIRYEWSKNLVLTMFILDIY